MQEVLKCFPRIDRRCLVYFVAMSIWCLRVLSVNAEESKYLENEMQSIVDIDIVVAETPTVKVNTVSELVEAEEDVDTSNLDTGIEITTLVKENTTQTLKEVITKGVGNVLDVPNDTEGCKSANITYMPYTAVTCRESGQYRLLFSDICYTDPVSGIRMVEGRYCIAVGSYYTTQIGQKIDLYFTDGTILNCILGDCKADCDTNETNQFHAIDGSVAEFIVDYEVFSSSSQWADICSGKIDKVVLVQ